MAQVEEFVGIDVSKLTLDVVILPDRECFKVDNDDAGWAELIKRLAGRKLGAVGIEASGGYERGLLGALLDAGLPARRLNPHRVRCFAQDRLEDRGATSRIQHAHNWAGIVRSRAIVVNGLPLHLPICVVRRQSTITDSIQLA
ncbi:IS110 family transposase [Sphingomonas sp.]|uniref:IS110 family transposase n=1 Tax=Sphingomonas sp. TaxID=28214 RepID=UPI002FCA3402